MRFKLALLFGFALIVVVIALWSRDRYIVHQSIADLRTITGGIVQLPKKRTFADQIGQSRRLSGFARSPVEGLTRSNIGLQRELTATNRELSALRQKIRTLRAINSGRDASKMQPLAGDPFNQSNIALASYESSAVKPVSVGQTAFRHFEARTNQNSVAEPEKDDRTSHDSAPGLMASHVNLQWQQAVTNEKLAALEKQLNDLKSIGNDPNAIDHPNAIDDFKSVKSQPPATASVPKSRIAQTQFDDGELEEISPLQFDDESAEYDFELPFDERRLEKQNTPAPTQDLPSQEFLADFTTRLSSTSLTNAPTKIQWSLDDALNAALLYSYQADSLRIEPLESLQEVGIEVGAFDLAAFFETNYNDSNTPVGNNFETDGTSQRVRGEEFTFAHGVRRQLRSGGEFELREQFSTRDDDSGVLNPPNQANSQLSLSFSKEILRGSGRSIAGNEVLVAQLNANVSSLEATGQIADLLQEVSNTYWDIFAARGALLSAIDNVQATKNILNDLLARRDIDAEPDLVEQARATVIRQTVLADRAYQELASAQFTLVRLVNAPELLENRQKIEIIPIVDPEFQTGAPDIESRLNTAIHNRPEVRAVVEDIQRARIENHLSLNELLPRLTFNSEATFEGLAGNRDLATAARERFDSSATYQLGFEFEVPLANRQARYRKRQVELELARLSKDWKLAIERVKEEVMDASFGFNTNQGIVDKQRAIFRSTQIRLNDVRTRQVRIPKENSIPALQLGRLIDAQTEFGQTKADFAAAIADRGRALIDLNRATGILVQSSIPGIGDPGRNCFIKVFHQYLEEEKGYRPLADTITNATRLVSKKHVRKIGHKHFHANEPSANGLGGFGFPMSNQPVVQEEHFQPLPQQIANVAGEASLHADQSISQAANPSVNRFEQMNVRPTVQSRAQAQRHNVRSQSGLPNRGLRSGTGARQGVVPANYQTPARYEAPR